jgi:hypothetical protein
MEVVMPVLGSYEKARLYIEKHYDASDEARNQKRKLNPGPIITISRETGIGANFICEKLTEYFNSRAIKGYDDWTYFDRELMEKIMDDHHLPEHFRKYLLEKKDPIFRFLVFGNTWCKPFQNFYFYTKQNKQY